MIKLILTVAIFSVVLSGCIPKVARNDKIGSRGEFIKGQVVEGFPNIPLYKGSDVIETYGENGNFGASFVVGEDLEKIVNFYAKYLPAAGWEANLSQKSADNFVFDVKNAAHSGTIIVNTAADGKKTAITVSLEPR